MACSHAEGCPLFPLLNASLRGWRDYYCDSDVRSRECARNKVALTGEPVPITLLPNGATANLLSGPAAGGQPTNARPTNAGPQQPARSYQPPPPRPAPSYQPSPPPGNPRAQPPRPPRRRWWTRLADWISGPA